MRHWVFGFLVITISSMLLAASSPVRAQCSDITAAGHGDAPGGGTGATAQAAKSEAEAVAKGEACKRAKDNLKKAQESTPCPPTGAQQCMLESWGDTPTDCDYPNPGPNGEPNPKPEEPRGSGGLATDPEWQKACERAERYYDPTKKAASIRQACRRRNGPYWDLEAAHADIGPVTGKCVPNPFGTAQSSTFQGSGVFETNE